EGQPTRPGSLCGLGRHARWAASRPSRSGWRGSPGRVTKKVAPLPGTASARTTAARPDRKSTRLNSSHVESSYAVFCLKKKNQTLVPDERDIRYGTVETGNHDPSNRVTACILLLPSFYGLRAQALYRRRASVAGDLCFQ